MLHKYLLSALLVTSSVHGFQPAPRVPVLPVSSRSTLYSTLVEKVNGATDASAKITPAPRPNAVSPVVPAPKSKPAAPQEVHISLLETPPEAYQLMADKGASNAKMSKLKTFVSAMLGGAYVGMGGMLSLAIAGNLGTVAQTNPGLAKLVFATLFPVNLLLCVQAGGQLFTGNTANMAAAVCEKKATMRDLAKSWGIAFAGNLIACSTFAVLCKYCGVLSGGAADLAVQTLIAKTSQGLGPIFVKAMLCNWLVCLAVYLSFQAKDMTGKYVSILLPISTFVSIGFEHSVANMFLLPAGLLCTTGIAVKTAVIKNLIPVAIGNAVSGSMMVGVLFSFLFGRLGKDK